MKMKGQQALGLLCFILLSLIACDSRNPSSPIANETLAGKLTITGSSTVAPLANEIAKQFEGLHPRVRIDVQTGGSSRGIADTRQRVADIGMVSRALKKNENDLHAFTIAKDGIGVILNKQNPLTRLNHEAIINIYKGNVTNWRQVGGTDAPITVINKAEGRSTLELFLQFFDLKNSEIRAHLVIGDNEQGVKSVAGNANAIGYVSIGTAEYDIAQGVPIKLIPLDGIEANSLKLAEGTYPLTRELNLVTRSPPEGLVKTFIEFARSEHATPLIEEQSFVAVAP